MEKRNVKEKVLDIIEEEGEILQSEIKPKLEERFDWAEDYSKGSLSSRISREVKMLEAEGKIELDPGHYSERGGRATNNITYQGE